MSEEAVSEIVSVVILIGIVLVGAGIITALVLSNPPPEKIPSVNVQVMSGPGAGDAHAYFLNGGGDSLDPSQIIIRAYDAGGAIVGDYSADDLYIGRKDSDGKYVFTDTWADDGANWGYGDVIRTPDAPTAVSYHILYTPGTGEYLLKEFGRGSGYSGPSAPGICEIETVDLSETHTGILYTFTPSPLPDTAAGDQWGYTITSKNYLKSIPMGGSPGGILTYAFPNPSSGGDEKYTVRYWVARYQDNVPCAEANASLQVTIHPADVCGDHDCPLTADFSWRYNAAKDTVFFSDLSACHDDSQNRWDFVGGIPSNHTGAAPPGVSFSGNGPFYATLTTTPAVADSCWDDVTVSRQIAGPLCVVTTDFSVSKTYNALTPAWDCTFIWTPNAEVKNKKWEAIWDFGDGSEPVIVHNYVYNPSVVPQYHSYNSTKPGEYVVTLTVKPHGCPSYKSTRVVVIADTCEDQPTACFTMTSDIQPNGELIVYVDGSCSEAPPGRTITRWEWSWGDGSSSVQHAAGSLPHTYPATYEGKTYPITLRVTDNTGCQGSVTDTVSSRCPDLTAKFSYQIVDIDANSYTVRFTDESGPVPGITRWDWSFGDGQNSSVQNPPDITYTTLTPHTVHLSVKYDNCEESFTRDIAPICPQVRPLFDLVKIDSTHIEVTDTSYHYNDIVAWVWDFGDGNTTMYTRDTYQAVTPHEYNKAGDYPVTLTIRNGCGETETLTRLVSCPPVEGITFSPLSRTGDAPLEIKFTPTANPDVVNWIWNFGDGMIEERTTTEPVPHTYQRMGNYTVTLIGMNDCGSSGRKDGMVTITCPPLQANFTAIPHVDKAAGKLEVDFTDISPSPDRIDHWRWDFGDGSAPVSWNRTQWAEAGGSYTHRYPEPAPYTATLTVRSECGSSDQVRQLIYNQTPCDRPFEVNFTPLERDGTAPMSIRFTDTSDNATAWNWNFGDGFSSEEQHPTHLFNRSGNFSVTLTASNECGNSGVKTGIVTLDCPNVTADYGYEYLAADQRTKNLTVRFTDASQGYGTPITRWSWDFGDGNRTNWTPATRPADGSVINLYPETAPYTAVLEVENECGSVDRVHKLVFNGSVCEDINVNFTPLYANGSAPFLVNFKDLTTGNPTRWHWDFGDGSYGELVRNASVTSGDISHTYTRIGRYTVTLMATGECGKAGVKHGTVEVGCNDVTVDFRYEIHNPESDDPLNVTFYITEPSDPEVYDTITEWTWLFGDGTVSHEENPTHLYPGRQQYNVILFAKNFCGNEGKNERLVILDCINLTPQFNLSFSDLNGRAPLTVTFDENSTPPPKVTGWRWYFGDGNYTYTTDPLQRNPPPYTYTKPGRYYVTLQVQNECTQQFSLTKVINVTMPVNISGNLWNDMNLNGIRDPGEPPLPNWNVTLQERISGLWVNRTSQLTDTDGDYHFFLPDVTYGTFRVVEDINSVGGIWKPTYSYGTGAQTYSSSLLVYDQRDFTGVDFGNVEWHSSSYQFPRGFYYPGRQIGGMYNIRTINTGEYWDFTVSYNNSPFRLWNPKDRRTTPYIHYQVPPNEGWGDSSFNITIGYYARYLIPTGGGTNGSIGTPIHWLDHWVQDGVITPGFTMHVPDNTWYTCDGATTTNPKAMLFFVQNNTPWFEIYQPFEGETIPYSKNSYVEAHITAHSSTSRYCQFLNPLPPNPPGSTGTYLFWNGTLGFYQGWWNNTMYEGQTTNVSLMAYRGGGTLTPNQPRYLYSMRNVTVDWEPITVTITYPAPNQYVQGSSYVNATVTGKNRDVDNVYLVLGNSSAPVKMTYYPGADTFGAVWNCEPYAGQTLPITVRAIPLNGKVTNSTPVMVRVGSTNPLIADFTADPMTGPAPLEVGFTDTSTGGPASWEWNFGDGSPNQTGTRSFSHQFTSPGTYNVTLTVRSIDATAVSSVRKTITVDGVWHMAELDTMRNGYIEAGGSVQWRMIGNTSYATVNGVRYNLTTGDRVRMSLPTRQTQLQFQMDGIITNFSAGDVELWINGALIDRGPCTDIWVREFYNLHSDLQVRALRNTRPGISVLFLWDGAPVPGYDFSLWRDMKRDLVVTSLMPDAGGRMNLLLSPDRVVFQGRAASQALVT